MAVIVISLGTPQGAGENCGCTVDNLEVPAQSQEAPATSLGAPVTCLGAQATSLGAPRITVEQSGNNTIFYGNASGVPGNHSYYLSFNDC